MTTSEKILRTAVVSALFAVALALLSRLLFGVPSWLIGIFWLIPFLLAYGLPLALFVGWTARLWLPSDKPSSGKW